MQAFGRRIKIQDYSDFRSLCFSAPVILKTDSQFSTGALGWNALHGPAIAAMALVFSCGGAGAQSADGDGWVTEVQAVPRAPVASGPLDLQTPDISGATGFYVNVEDSRGVDLRTQGDAAQPNEGFVILRRDLVRNKAGGVYYGGGVGFGETLSAEADPAAASKLVGGIAAPVSTGVSFYGEYQHIRPFETGDADDRFQFGLRRSF